MNLAMPSLYPRLTLTNNLVNDLYPLYMDQIETDRLADPKQYGKPLAKFPPLDRRPPPRQSYRVESIVVAQQALIEHDTQDVAIAHLEGLVALVREQALETADILEYLELQLEAIDFLKALGHRRDDELMVMLAIIQTYF